MGAWAETSFGNDDALDFVDSLKDANQVFDLISDLSNRDDYIEADEASIAIAACDVLAAMIGRAAADMPEIDAIKGRDPASVETKVLKSANSLIQRVRTDSELVELWEEDDPSDWHAALDDLVLRLDLSKPYSPQQSDAPDDEEVYGHCVFCEKPTSANDTTSFVIEMGGAEMTTHAHRSCVENQFEAPHWNADGSPSAEAIAQFKKMLGL